MVKILFYMKAILLLSTLYASTTRNPTHMCTCTHTGSHTALVQSRKYAQTLVFLLPYGVA